MKQTATFDSSFWINAYRAGLLPHVRNAYVLRYTHPVARELEETYPSGREFWRLVRAREVTQAAVGVEQVQEFGAGERAAINVALEHRDWILLLDDLRPFQTASRLGLNVLCSPVLAVMLHSQGVLSDRDVLMMLARLAVMQTVSPHLLAAALAQLGRSMQHTGGA